MGEQTLMIPALLFASILFTLFYFGDKTELPLDEVRVEDQPSGVVAGDDTSQAVLMEKIRAQMQDQQLFRSKGLTVTEPLLCIGLYKPAGKTVFFRLCQQLAHTLRQAPDGGKAAAFNVGGGRKGRFYRPCLILSQF